MKHILAIILMLAATQAQATTDRDIWLCSQLSKSWDNPTIERVITCADHMTPDRRALAEQLLQAQAPAEPGVFEQLLAIHNAKRSTSGTVGVGNQVYSAAGCTGPVIMGVCHGAMLGQPVGTCHGQMLNGVCTGPMF